MKLGDGRSVISHSVILGPFLIHVPNVLDYNGRSASERINLKLLAKVPKSLESITITL